MTLKIQQIHSGSCESGETASEKQRVNKKTAFSYNFNEISVKSFPWAGDFVVFFSVDAPEMTQDMPEMDILGVSFAQDERRWNPLMAQSVPKMAEDGARGRPRWVGSVLGSMGQGWGRIFCEFVCCAEPRNLETLAKTP